jgi:hypothetical protein
MDAVLVAYIALLNVNALVISMNPPKSEDGVYAFFYRYTRQITNTVDTIFERRYNLTVPHAALLDPKPEQVETENPTQEK